MMASEIITCAIKAVSAEKRSSELKSIQSFKGRLHELIKCPFSAPISGSYVVNRSVLALETGPFRAHVNTPLGYYTR